ncbi:putative DsbA family dithiol-disulfide isomerase [Actinocorallia herbida]|uniref:Putative DsbA family dithiol-disulfide isomerase n=1 Tax=Actinocorallia herbida TaxID=58109 RepID=A0A3N1CRJ6_9ACTN|nr:DsbA family oxidoreductase [Actinocorallia herbida]ROO83931.1 putative DsbA family dithiol-disulfide isomerase [Actinocorallia herbida]
MKIEIYSDVVCPWCYLGQARFRQAVEEFPGEVEIVWRPFQLDPSSPAEPEAGLASTVLAEKFGGADKVHAAHQRLRALTEDAGLPFEPELARQINSLQAHRVIWLAGEEGVQDAVVARFFRAHHAEGRDLNAPETLVELAAEAGLPADRVRALLASAEGAPEVAAQIDEARRLGISGVPFFLFEGKWAVSGGQPTEVFAEALREVASKL